ncbi:MAG: hypothetical protein OHK0012_17870 [Synechococcales cyanobacterium]
MTPEQILEAFQSQLRFNQDIQSRIEDLTARQSELTEGQALLMSYLREQDARRDLERLEFNRDMRELRQEIADLRRDFLNHMRAYHPPAER